MKSGESCVFRDYVAELKCFVKSLTTPVPREAALPSVSGLESRRTRARVESGNQCKRHATDARRHDARDVGEVATRWRRLGRKGRAEHSDSSVGVAFVASAAAGGKLRQRCSRLRVAAPVLHSRAQEEGHGEAWRNPRKPSYVSQEGRQVEAGGL